MALEDEVRAQTQSIDRLVGALTSNKGGSSAGGGISLGSTGNGLNTFNGVVDQVTGGLRKVATGSADVGTGLSVLSGVLTKIPVIGDSLSSITRQTGEYGIELNKTVNDMGRSGVTFQNNLGLTDEAIKGARMTTDEFADRIRKGGTSISGLDRTVEHSALGFLRFTKDVQESDLTTYLRTAGWTSKDFSDLTQISMQNRRTLDLSDAKARQSAQESVYSLAFEMDQLSRLTGKSRDQQMQELKQGLDKAEVQAELLMLDDKAREQYMQMRTQVGPLGKSLQDLADEIYTGGVRTKEGSMRMAALGPAAQDFEKAILARKEAANIQDPREREAALKRADAMMEGAKQDIARYQQSREFLMTVSRANQSEIGKEMAKQMQENSEANGRQIRIMKEQQEASQQGVKLTREEAAARAEAKAKADVAKSQAGVGPETTRADSAVGRAMNDTNRALQDQAAGLGTQFRNLNTNVGASVEKYRQVNGVLDTLLKPRTQGEAASSQNIPKAITPSTAVPKSAAPAGYNPTAVQRNEGSFGAVGKWIEDFGKGTLAVLHGKEGVITEKQFNDLFGNIGTANKSSPTTNQKQDTSANTPELAKRNKTESNVKSTDLISIDNLDISKISKGIFNEPLFNKLLNDVQTTSTSSKDILKTASQAGTQKTEAKDTLKAASLNNTPKLTPKVETPKMPFNEKMFDSLLGSSTGVPKAPTIPIDKQISNKLSGMQSSLSMELEKNKANMPKVSDFQAIAAKMESAVSPTTQKSTTETTQPLTDNTAMTDVKDQLVQLNTLMSQLLSHTADVANNTNQQIRATRSLSGNMLS